MGLTYSRFFKVKHRDFLQKGVYNAFLDQDSLLHIDPLLLKGSEIPEFTNAYTEFFNYFRLFIPLVKASKADNLHDPFFKKMVNRFTFKEIPNTGLGFSKGNTKGRGISGALSIQLAHSAYTIINAGLEDPEIFGLMQLIEDNMAADRISDMTIAILQKHFLEYTQRIAQEMGLTTHPYTFEYGLVFQVPYYKGKPIHFIPESFLADLPVAHDFEDIDSVCNYNNRLKRKIAELIGINWSDYKNYKKDDWKNLIIGNKDCYEAAISFYKSLNAVPYDFVTDNKNQYRYILLQELLDEIPFQKPTEYANEDEEVYKLTLAMCYQFKHLVAHNRLSELFYRNNRTPDETDWQLLLYTVADTYKIAGNLDLAITREDNPGVGEIDFHITKGSKANTVIEIKRSTNENLIHGYRTQLPAYMKAERAKTGIFMIIMEKDNIEEIKQKFTEVQKDMLDNDEYIPEIIYINGMKQYSASNRNYKFPEFT